LSGAAGDGSVLQKLRPRGGFLDAVVSRVGDVDAAVGCLCYKGRSVELTVARSPRAPFANEYPFREEAARKLAGNKGDDRFTDPVKGLIEKEKRNLEKTTERVKRSYRP